MDLIGRILRKGVNKAACTFGLVPLYRVKGLGFRVLGRSLTRPVLFVLAVKEVELEGTYQNLSCSLNEFL